MKMQTQRPQIIPISLVKNVRPSTSGRPWTSEQWCRYFEANDLLESDIPWHEPGALTDHQRRAIADSIREFQAGENSEGRHLTRCAAEHARERSDFSYVRAMRYLIAEEQRHARDLGRFMIASRIPLVETTPVDVLFRRLRKLAGLEVMIGVLVTAEIIAQVYYRALRAATQAAALRKLCERILRDEVFHVRFQCERLAILRAGRSRLALSMTHALQHLLFFGALMLVGIKHAPALRLGGFSLGRWWRAGWRQYGRARQIMDPRSYKGATGGPNVLVPGLLPPKQTDTLH